MPVTESETAHKDHVVLGMSAAVGAFLSFTVMNVLAKQIGRAHV